MKRFLLWLVGVVLGVGVFLGAVMGVSYAFTTEGGCPDSTAQFGTEALERLVLAGAAHWRAAR